MDILWSFVSSYPWFTWVVVSALMLILLGILGALVGMVGHAARWCLCAAWMGLQVLVIKVTGCRWRSWGTAHWAGLRELKRANLLNTTGIAVGEWRGKILREPRGGHILIMSPPRSGKSFGFIMPALREYQGSVLVTDLRGELFERTSHDREKFGPVHRFDPGGEKSCSLNILDSVRWGTAYQYGDLMRMLRHLYPVKGDIADIYRSSAIPLAMAIALYGHREGLESFPSLVRWMLAPSQTMEEKLQTLARSPDILIQQGARRTLDASARMRQSLWTTLIDPLTLFCDPVIASHTEHSDVVFDELMYGAQPSSLYLSMGFHDVPRLGPLLGLMTDVLVALLGSPETPPRHKIALVLDEAANLGRLSELEHAVSYLQGSGTQCVLVFQNMRQYLQRYGEDSPLFGSITTQVHYVPTDVTTATTVSSHLGQSTVPAQTVNPQGGVTISEHERPLLTAGEVLTMGEETAIILSKNVAPVFARKVNLPVPATTLGKVRLRWSYHPYAYACGVGCLLLALALWPVVQGGGALHKFVTGSHQQVDEPTTPPTRPLWTPPPPQEIPVMVEPPTKVETPAEKRWVMTNLMTSTRGEVLEVERGRYATAEDCSAGLAGQRWVLNHTRQSGHWKVEMVEDDATHVAWQQSMPGTTVRQRQGAWCRELTR